MTDNLTTITPADEAEITLVIRRYSEHLDGREFAKLADAYTETGSLVNSFEEYIPGGEAFTGTLASGADAVATAVGNLMGPLDATQHLLGAIIIDATEDGARTQTQVLAQHHRAGGFYDVGGTYIDRFVRTDKGWRIEVRELHTLWAKGEASVVSGD
jgi:hypothetical protein